MLKITLVQTSLHWENIPANLQMFSEHLSGMTEKTDLVILPEMFSTGFSMNTEMLAEDENGVALEWMKSESKRGNYVITGSLIVKENRSYYNRLYWVRPDGSYEIYDKRHLFTMAGEQNHYSSGNIRLIVELNGWRICPLICYDLRFPLWSRNLPDSFSEKSPFDLLIYVANFPARRSLAWKTLLPARAVENQCYVAGLNRVGEDGKKISYSGDSAVYNPFGEIIIDTTPGEISIKTVELSLEELFRFRKDFPVLNDGDAFELKS